MPVPGGHLHSIDLESGREGRSGLPHGGESQINARLLPDEVDPAQQREARGCGTFLDVPVRDVQSPSDHLGHLNFLSKSGSRRTATFEDEQKSVI